MYRLEITQLKGPSSNPHFIRALHHLRNLGCETHLQCEREHCVADVQMQATLNARMRAEIELTLARLARHLSEPALVSLRTEDGEFDHYIGPRARELSRAIYLQRAAFYAARAGERDLSQALRQRQSKGADALAARSGAAAAEVL
jgi:hypothetical protein